MLVRVAMTPFFFRAGASCSFSIVLEMWGTLPFFLCVCVCLLFLFSLRHARLHAGPSVSVGLALRTNNLADKVQNQGVWKRGSWEPAQPAGTSPAGNVPSICAAGLKGSKLSGAGAVRLELHHVQVAEVAGVESLPLKSDRSALTATHRRS